MGYATIWAYVWDFLNVGISKGLRELKDAGLDAVSLASKYHTVEHLQTRSKTQKWFVARNSAFYFQPQMSLYKNTTIKPYKSPLVKEGDLFGKVCDAAERAGLKVIAWTVFLHDTRTGLSNPDACMVNCFGDVYTSNLCPSNFQVREFAKAIVKDLSRYPLMAIECESLHFGGIGHFHAHEKIGVQLGDLERVLLGLCFCDSCQKIASKRGLKMKALKRQLADYLEVVFQTGKPLAENLAEFSDRYPDLKALLEVMKEVVTSLVSEVSESSKVPLSFILMGSQEETGASAELLKPFVQRFEILAYTHNPKEVRSKTQKALKEIGDGERLVVGLQAYQPAVTEKETLMALVEAAKESGAKNISFYHYGIMPPAHLDWVKEAIASKWRSDDAS